MAASKEQIRMAEELLFSGEPKTSFVKRLYFGLFDAQRVLPFPEPPDEEKKREDELIARVKTFAEERVDPAATPGFQTTASGGAPSSALWGSSSPGNTADLAAHTTLIVEPSKRWHGAAAPRRFLSAFTRASG